jgi:tRNA wybutosine-synthesizing protein 2
MRSQFLTLEVPRHHVKAVKTALESKKLRGGNCKITRKASHEEVYLMQSRIAATEGSMTEEGKSLLLRDLNLLSLQDDINISTYEVINQRPKHCYSNHKMDVYGELHPTRNDPLSHALRDYLESLDASFWADLDYDAEDLIQGQHGSFLKYTVASKPDGSRRDQFLFLPQMWFNDDWYDMIHNRLNRPQPNTNRTYWDAMMEHIAKEMKVSHIAFQRPLLRVVSSGKGDGEQVLNVQRRPQLAPLWGKFPDFVDLDPSQQDFDKALWLSTKQNGITQIWVPAYSMFSPGNVEEKARILQIVTTPPGVETARRTAIDMYAGIGYFAFSYLKAGFDKVLAFEINPWSIEGLKRGAAANGWEYVVITENDINRKLKWQEMHDPKNRLLIFYMDNNRAVDIAKTVNSGERFPPIQHINLGLLPTSSASWCDAVMLLDFRKGGWLHVHENMPEDWRWERKFSGIRSAIEAYARDRWETRAKVWVPKVVRVKSYAPGESSRGSIASLLSDSFAPD